MSSSAELKAIADAYFREGNFSQAVEAYTTCIEANSTNAILYCNRSAAHLKLSQHIEAKSDAEKACEFDPCYVKAFCRLASAELELKHPNEALNAMYNAQHLHPSPAYFTTVKLAIQQMMQPGASQQIDFLSIDMFLYAMNDKQCHPGVSLSLEEAVYCLNGICSMINQKAINEPMMSQLIRQSGLIATTQQLKKKYPHQQSVQDPCEYIISRLVQDFYSISKEWLPSTKLIDEAIAEVSSPSAHPQNIVAKAQFLFKSIKEDPALLKRLLNSSNSRLIEGFVNHTRTCVRNFENYQINLTFIFQLLRKFAAHGDDAVRQKMISCGILDLANEARFKYEDADIDEHTLQQLYDPEHDGNLPLVMSKMATHSMFKYLSGIMAAIMITPSLRPHVLHSVAQHSACIKAVCKGYLGNDNKLQFDALNHIVKDLKRTMDIKKRAEKPRIGPEMTPSQYAQSFRRLIAEDILKMNGVNAVLEVLKKEMQKPREARNEEWIHLIFEFFGEMSVILPKELLWPDEVAYLDIPAIRLEEAAAIMIRCLQNEYKDDYVMHLKAFSALRNMIRSGPLLSKIAKTIECDHDDHDEEVEIVLVDEQPVGRTSEEIAARLSLNPNDPVLQRDLMERVPFNATRKVYAEFVQKHYKTVFGQDAAAEIGSAKSARTKRREEKEKKKQSSPAEPSAASSSASPKKKDFSDDLADLMPLLSATIERFGREEGAEICGPVADTLLQLCRIGIFSPHVLHVVAVIFQSKCIPALIEAINSSSPASSFSQYVEYSKSPEARVAKFICQITKRMNVKEPRTREALEESGAPAYLRAILPKIPSSAAKLKALVSKAHSRLQ